jgi:ethanolamine utilization protein EutA
MDTADRSKGGAVRGGRELFSVGIDVGTTTTQIVFSRLQLRNTAPAMQVPRIGIADRIVLYQSPIHLTPLATRVSVDVIALEQIVRGEYERAGFSPAQVDTGAVIVTGEIAKKENAAEILRVLGRYAGEFIVTVAGPRLEAQIAGRGSGAAAWSREHYARVTNVDIGGGSANAAVFELGNTLAASALNIGGRIIEVDHSTMQIRHIADPARKIIQHLMLPIGAGQRAEMGPLRAFCEVLADLTVELIEGHQSALSRDVSLAPPMSVSGRSTKLFVSGGVGLYFYHPVGRITLEEITIHDDIGPLYGLCLREHPTISHMETVEPPETIRATGIGASSQTVTLSGSTIWTDREILPLKNIPVVHPLIGRTASIAESLREALTRMEIDIRSENAAIAVDLPGELDFNRLQILASGLVEYAALDLPPERPLILILAKDYAQSLGQTIKGMLPSRSLLAIDQIGLEEGDYIDIGLPMMEGRVVPLSVKTLVFLQ